MPPALPPNCSPVVLGKLCYCSRRGYCSPATVHTPRVDN
ncbi:hypothetical protein SLEP1_g39471 [Rubroshorea leprosula]|uniref:Uncharacterized protein n=1 Tax=Rubroshorea leprosula TaxID=152421 RepID=A0AAV5L144_9ROSI|nr:hypothetical protein SLEP1_g39471 [Rubroshorea leprosula]